MISKRKPLKISNELLSAVENYISKYYTGDESLKTGVFLSESVDSYSEDHFIKEKQIKYRKTVESGKKPFPDSEMIELFTAQQAPVHDARLKAAPVQAAAPMQAAISMPEPAPAPPAATLDSLIGNLDESFSATLLRLIDAKGKKDADVYNRANIDRRLFSKIRGNEQYTPSKATVLAFAVALELSLDQTGDLLKRAGFTLSRSRKFDVIIEYFIQNRRYDIFEINEVLYSYDQPLLGGQ